nr:endopeptidase, NLPC/P60 domain, LRAT-like domain protein [Tanacetum cinerariifolium]
MLSSKWNTLNHNFQKFNAIYKRCSRLTKSDESELDVMKQARTAYRDENKNSTFTQEDAWDLLRKHLKWDAPSPAPIDLTEDEEILAVNTDELFGPDARPRPPGKQRPEKKNKSDTSVSNGGSSSSSQFGDIMTKHLCLKREADEAAFEVAKEKDRTLMRLEERKFLAISTKDLSEDDVYFIEEQKEAIRAKYNLYQNPGSNPEDSLCYNIISIRIFVGGFLGFRFIFSVAASMNKMMGKDDLNAEPCKAVRRSSIPTG